MFSRQGETSSATDNLRQWSINPVNSPESDIDSPVKQHRGQNGTAIQLNHFIIYKPRSNELKNGVLHTIPSRTR